MIKKDDGCLISFLIFIIISSCISIFFNIMFFEHFDNTTIINSIVLSILQILSAFLIMYGKKIGIYIYILIGITNVILTFIVGKNMVSIAVAIFFISIPYILLFFLLSRNKTNE